MFGSFTRPDQNQRHAAASMKAEQDLCNLWTASNSSRLSLRSWQWAWKHKVTHMHTASPAHLPLGSSPWNRRCDELSGSTRNTTDCEYNSALRQQRLGDTASRAPGSTILTLVA